MVHINQPVKERRKKMKAVLSRLFDTLSQAILMDSKMAPTSPIICISLMYFE